MIDEKKNTHKMTLFNHDMVIKWILEDNRIKITDINILYNGNNNLINFLSGKVFKLIVDDIQKHGVKI